MTVDIADKSKTIDFTAQIKAARRAGVPIVAISTPDPAATIGKVCQGINGSSPKVQWDVVRGFAGLDDSGTVNESTLGNDVVRGIQPCIGNPIEACDVARRFPEGTVFLIHNASKFFQDVSFVQAVWNLRDSFKVNGRMIVLLGISMQLPPELAGDVITIDEPLPSVGEIAGIVSSTKELWAAAAAEQGFAPIDMSIPKATEALRGLTAFQVEQIASMSMNTGGCDYDFLWQEKIHSIEQTPGLSVYHGGDSFDDLGGLASIKYYFTRLMQKQASAIVWLDEIEKSGLAHQTDLSGTNSDQLGQLLSYMEDNKVYGVILLGPPGTGKSAFAKATGAEFDKLVIRIDMGAMKGSLVGQSEGQLRQALKVVTSVGGKQTMWIATSNSADHLDAALRSRFTDVFYFDMPTKEELDPIWEIWKSKYGLGGDASRDNIPDCVGWTGRNVQRCCEKAFRMDCSLSEAASYIIPTQSVIGEDLERLRSQANGRYLSASYPGPYRKQQVEHSRRQLGQLSHV
jgi:hypothetical protein